MKKKHVMAMSAVLFITMFAVLIFSQTHFSVLKIYEEGINRGEDISYIEQGWEYTAGYNETRYRTTLPCVLELKKGVTQLNFIMCFWRT